MEPQLDSEEKCSCATDKALEYYLKFGKERNIEKFLRLQPARIHSHTHCKYKMSRNEQPHCSTAITSQILPLEISEGSLEEEKSSEHQNKSETENKEESDKAEVAKAFSSASSSDTNASATLVRIFRESVEAEILRKSGKDSKLASAVSDEDLRTPPKNKSRETPRSNRRLEWDSLADIGYRRCKSQSNISVLERMVLKQLLQDCSENNLTERDFKLLEVLLHEQDGSQITRTKSLDTPPLASSTHIELKQKQKQATPDGQEKSVQTTISRASKSTQEVQVNIETNKLEKSTEVEINNTDSELSAEQKQEPAAYVCDTLLESTSTEGFQVPTGKSFYRSKSLDTTGAQSNDVKRFEKAIQSGISSLSNTSEDERRTALGELEKTLEEQLLKRKKSTDKHAATMQLELGVQLLCALIEALNLQKSEKQTLVTEIVQRICRTCGNTAAGELLTMLKPRMKGGESKSTSGTTSQSEEITKKEKTIRKENNLPAEVAGSSTNRELVSKATNTHITRAKKVENAANGSKRTITTQTSFEPIYISKSADSKVPEISSSTTSRENMAISDWLQPTTLSELEYEQYKQEIAWNSKKRQSIMEQSLGDISGKQQMLTNWLKMEIRRLERLRSLMQNNKDYASSSSHMQSSSISDHSNIVPNRKEPIYDQVADTLKAKPMPVRKHVINVEINQDKENKFSEPRVQYIQPLMKEDTVLRERNKQHSTKEFTLKVQQRSKMATPTTSESLTSFEAQSEKLPKQKTSNEAQTEETHACTCRHVHEAIPNNNYYYPYHHHHHQFGNWHCCGCHNAGAPQYKTTATVTTTTTNVATQKPSTSSLTSKSSQSSSSRRNTQTYTLPINVVEKNSLTSEVSVPMGSSTMSSSSASRNTHQYDDLNAVRDIAVQTSKLSLQSEQSEIVETGLRMQAKSIAYVLEFHAPKAPRHSQAESSTDLSDNIESLQAHLEKKRPMFVAKSKERKAMLNRLQKLRQQREKELRELVENTSINSIEPKLKTIPPLPRGQVRLYSTKQMKAITRKRASKLPEVLAREQREKEERRRRSNRLLRDLFSRRLQKRVRIGQISLNHSKTVI